ncbi:hypothetical protein [Xanthocytophaga flava]|uniref:hypothetical protein n=1 Tax=Xanthocytophaga flava TaxID=3048013 RepID=UPI0028CFFF9E|nr:hypothetical protein [Xanthocytophaga flavus]
MKRIIYCIFLICLLPTISWAQESDEDDEYQTDFLYGINFNTNGGLIGGLVLRYSTVIDSKMKQTFGLEIVNVKHPKEIRSQSATNGNTYIYGKSNYLFAIRPQYGRELLLFRKAPEEGVRISAIGAIGPSFGIVKPYFIALDDGFGNVTIEQFDPGNIRHSQQNILGSAAFTRLTGTKIAMGIHAKAGLSFEIGGFRSSATGFEVGALVEAYTKKVIIVPLAENRSVFTSIYLNIFFKSKR